MPSENNPGGRLFLILNGLRKNQDNQKLLDAWAYTLQVGTKDQGDVLTAIAEVLKLVEETKKQIMFQDVNHQVFMKPFVQIQKVFALGLDHKISHAKPFLTDEVMSRLEHCDELLSREIPEKILAEKLLGEMQQRVMELIKEVEESDLPFELKSMVLENLRSISWAIAHYAIHGAKGLKDATDRALGSMVNYSIHDNPRPDKVGEKLIARYGKLIFYAMSVVADAYALAQLTEGAIERVTPLLQ